MRFFKKSPVRTDPLVPEDSPSRDDDIEGGRRGRGVNLPPARKNKWDFPPQWRERQGIMTTWIYYTYFTSCCGFLCPVGMCLGICGSSLYQCQCCQPKGPEGGMMAALWIYLSAFTALILDLIGSSILVALFVYYTFAECPYKESICDWRRMVSLFLLGTGGFVFGRFIIALNVFLSMRDYRREMQRERRLKQFLEQETEARFKQYSKQKNKRHQREEEEEEV